MTKLIIPILLVLLSSPAWAGGKGMQMTVGGADVTAPTLSTVTIGTNGTGYTFAYSEAVTCTSTANCCDDYALAMTTAGAITLSYSSGSGSSSVVCTGTPTVNSGDTASDLDYTTVENGIVDGASNDLASFTNQQAKVTNNSTQGSSLTFSPATNSFSGSGGNDLTNWTTGNGTWHLVSGKLYVASVDVNDWADVYYGTATTSTSQWIEMYINASTAVILLRAATKSYSTGDAIIMQIAMGDSDAYVMGLDNGSPDDLVPADHYSGALAAGYYGVEISGAASSLTVNFWNLGASYVNRGSWGAATKTWTGINASAYTLGNYVGILDLGGVDTNSYDDISGGDQ